MILVKKFVILLDHHIVDIKIIDDFFSDTIHKQVWEYLHPTKPIWSLTGGSSQPNSYTFWHVDDLEKEEYFSRFLFKKIITKLGEKYSDYNFLRIYANGQTAGQSGNVHPDDGDVTFLYYPMPTWIYQWGGELIFCDSLKEMNYKLDERAVESQRVVRVRPNRAVLFPAKILHHATAPNRFFNNLRVSLAYKLIAPS